MGPVWDIKELGDATSVVCTVQSWINLSSVLLPSPPLPSPPLLVSVSLFPQWGGWSWSAESLLAPKKFCDLDFLCSCSPCDSSYKCVPRGPELTSSFQGVIQGCHIEVSWWPWGWWQWLKDVERDSAREESIFPLDSNMETPLTSWQERQNLKSPSPLSNVGRTQWFWSCRVGSHPQGNTNTASRLCWRKQPLALQLHKVLGRSGEFLCYNVGRDFLWISGK